jgi:hypothetical protein
MLSRLYFYLFFTRYQSSWICKALANLTLSLQSFCPLWKAECFAFPVFFLDLVALDLTVTFLLWASTLIPLRMWAPTWIGGSGQDDWSVRAVKKCNAIGKPPYYEIFSFWNHELLLMDDWSVWAVKKCNAFLPILILGQDTNRNGVWEENK